MTIESQNPPDAGSGSGFSAWLARFLRSLVRLTLIIILGALLGTGIFYAVPWVYRTYLQPLERGVSQLQDFQAAQEQTNQRTELRLNDYQTRLEELAIQVDNLKQTASELRAEVDLASGERQTLLEQFDSDLSEKEQQLSELNAELEATNAGVIDVESRSVALREDLLRIEADLKQVQEVLLSQDTPVAALRRELALVKAMEYLTRSRLFLAQNNLGIAAQDIQAARDLLAELAEVTPEYQREALTDIQERIELALEQLEDQPVLAAQDLEIAWQLLQKGLPGEPPLQSAEEGQAQPASAPTPTPRP